MQKHLQKKHGVKVLFVIRDLQVCERLGIMYMSSVAKRAGHETALMTMEDRNTHKVLSEYKPDVIAYSMHTGEHVAMLEFNRKLKERYDFLSVFGGPHATFFPEMIESEGVDVICLGEAEEAFGELLNALVKGKPIKKIRNLWIKDRYGRITKNPVRKLKQNLDEIPFPDRDLVYSHSSALREEKEKRMITGRGCPYRCTYCFNKHMSDMYGPGWSMVRKRSVDNIIEEALEMKEKYPLEFIKFSDDTFIMCDIEWLRELAEKFPKKVGLPFFCNVRANLVTPEVVKCLKKAGCMSVFLAIETANDEVRNGILRRGMSKEQINTACKLFREAGIKYGTYNILALPVDNPLKIDMETLRYNVELRPAMAWSSLLVPYPRTELGDYCIKHGYFDGNYDKILGNNKIESALEFKDPWEKRKVVNLQKLFGITVEFPFLMPVTKQLIKLPSNRLFNFVLMGWYGYTLKIRMSPEKVTPTKLIRWAKALTKLTKA